MTARPRRRRPEPPPIPPELRETLARLDGALRDLSGGAGAPPGFDPDRFLAPGVPRVRPLLVLLSAEAAAEAREQGALPHGPEATEHVAVAVELLHLAVVVHDAALGRAGGRRRRAARRLLGGAVGLLGANHLTLRALELARHAPAPEIVGDLLEAMREVAAGHALAHGLQRRLPSTIECMDHAEGHSGAVFAFACRSGARLAGATRPVLTGLGRYGRHVGIAWELAEDLATLDLEGEELVRAVEEQAAHLRPILPVSLAAERDPDIADLWLRLRRAPDPALCERIAAGVRETGAMAEGRRRLVLESWSARQALAGLPPSPPRDALDRLAAALVG